MQDNFLKITAPQLDVNDENILIGEWLIEPGDLINAGQDICTIETTKSVEEFQSDYKGFIYPVVKSGESIAQGDTIALVLNDNDYQIVEKFLNGQNSKKYEIQNHLKNKIDLNKYKLSKKAQKLISDLKIDISLLPENKLLKESDILAIVNKTKIQPVDNIEKGILDKDFIKKIKNDEEFRKLSSDLKIKIYKKFGAEINKDVILEPGSIIIADSIIIDSQTVIKKDSYIEVSQINIGNNCIIGEKNNWVADKIIINAHFRSAQNVSVDVSGSKSFESQLIVGENCLLCENVYINACRKVILKNNVCLSPRSMIFTHRYWQNVFNGYDAVFSGIVIEENSWVGSGAQVMAGVKIKEGSIILANSVVISNIEVNTIAGGIPAKVIKKINKNIVNFNLIYKNIIEFIKLRLEYLRYNVVVNKNKLNFIKNGNIGVVFIYDNTNKKDLDAIFENNKRSILIGGFDIEKIKDNVTLFNLKENSMKGQLDDVAFEVKNALRRYGIKIMEK